MATQVQNRRGTTAEHSTFTGANGELTVDTTKKTVVVHDGSTAGGAPLLRENGSQNTVTTGTSTAASFIPSSSTVPTNGVYLPAANSVAISTGGTGRVFIDSSGNIGVGQSASLWNTAYKALDGLYGGIAFRTNAVETEYVNNAYRNSAGNWIYKGSAPAQRLLQDDAGNTMLLTAGSGTAGGTVTFSERLRITSAGLVGVGTSTFGNADADDLTVAGSGNTGITVRAGTTSASNIYFADGTTGDDAVRGYFAYNHSADRLTIGTNAATALTIDSSQRVGVGDTGPDSTLTIKAAAATTPLKVSGPTSEFLRCDQQGRLLVGTSTNIRGSKLQVLSTDNDHQSLVGGNQIAQIELCRSSNSAGGAGLVADGNVIARIECLGNDGSAYRSAARIEAVVDGTPGANDMPGRLVFSTTADGASSPTERMRIGSTGTINFSNVAVYADNAAATTGGLAVGDVYRTSAGQLMIRY